MGYPLCAPSLFHTHTREWDMTEEFLTRKEAAAFLRVSLWSIHEFTHRHKEQNPLPARKAGRRDIFLVSELVTWTEEEERRGRRAKLRRAMRRKSPTSPE
jgi:hypothetical protein